MSLVVTGQTATGVAKAAPRIYGILRRIKHRTAATLIPLKITTISTPLNQIIMTTEETGEIILMTRRMIRPRVFNSYLRLLRSFHLVLLWKLQQPSPLFPPLKAFEPECAVSDVLDLRMEVSCKRNDSMLIMRWQTVVPSKPSQFSQPNPWATLSVGRQYLLRELPRNLVLRIPLPLRYQTVRRRLQRRRDNVHHLPPKV